MQRITAGAPLVVEVTLYHPHAYALQFNPTGADALRPGIAVKVNIDSGRFFAYNDVVRLPLTYRW